MDPHVVFAPRTIEPCLGCVLAYAECSPPSCPWHLPHDISTRLQTKERLLDVVRALVSELGHQPALASVGPAAHLERELGLGSLERVELLLRIEQAFGTRLDDRSPGRG